MYFSGAAITIFLYGFANVIDHVTLSLLSFHPFFGRILKECMRKFTRVEHFTLKLVVTDFNFV
jgi:hypothetical protein